MNELKEIIQKANPEIIEMTVEQRAIQQMAEHCDYVDDKQGLSLVNAIADSLDNVIGRPIRLADVLLALQANNISLDLRSFEDKAEGLMGIEKGVLYMRHGNSAKWNLKEDELSKQSEETINFLKGLLCEK